MKSINVQQSLGNNHSEESENEEACTNSFLTIDEAQEANSKSPEHAAWEASLHQKNKYQEWCESNPVSSFVINLRD
jgi:hypothetical protein